MKVLAHWFECSWEGVGPGKKGFVMAQSMMENDVSLRGLVEVLKLLVKALKAARSAPSS